ncbi:Glucose-repressible protein [Diaporthe australafricana]|uniref:Glucose-repressible protein n=1 Tax=Diaporthe australafricana TaxID=127596 RepID=A0ABR3X5F5_9PEZI
MDTIKSTANYVSDKISGTGHEASKEANKEVAKDSNVGIGNRAQAAGDALKDKANQHSDEASAEANKQKATH